MERPGRCETLRLREPTELLIQPPPWTQRTKPDPRAGNPAALEGKQGKWSIAQTLKLTSTRARELGLQAWGVGGRGQMARARCAQQTRPYAPSSCEIESCFSSCSFLEGLERETEPFSLCS